MGKMSRRSFAIGAGLAAGSILLGNMPANASPTIYRIGDLAVRYWPYPAPLGRPAIVMVHGGAHAGWVWDRWANWLSLLGWECHAIDWYHHGLSAPLPTNQFLTRSITAVSQEIGLVVNRLRGQGKRIVLMGHSMGGLAALHAATLYQPDQLVLVTPVVPAQVGATVIPLAIDLSVPYPVPPFPVAKAMFFATMTDSEATPYYSQLQPESPQAVWEATRWSVSINLSAITMPALALSASADTLTPPAAVQTLSQLLGGQYVALTGIGHSDVLLKSTGWLSSVQRVEQWLVTH